MEFETGNICHLVDNENFMDGKYKTECSCHKITLKTSMVYELCCFTVDKDFVSKDWCFKK